MKISRLWLALYTVAILILARLWRFRVMLAHVCLWHPRLPRGKQEAGEEQDREFYGSLDLRRKAQICAARAADYAEHLVLVPNEAFDLNATIFANVKGAMQRYILKKKLAVRMHWDDKFVDEVQSSLASLPRVMPPDTSLLDFMNDQCDFSCEHADGSFWDHLRFCYDYSAIHYASQSPRVLLLHSILGVGTNLFPCPAENIPTLEGLVDPSEMRHISAFPSILRLVLNGALLTELRASGRPLRELKKVTYHRVIDNAPMCLEGEEVVVHLNYQLMHLMDFLPAMDWEHNVDDPQLQVFVEWMAYLRQEGMLQAEVDMDVLENAKSIVSYRYVWMKLKETLFQRAVSKYSMDIGHSLAFELIYE